MTLGRRDVGAAGSVGDFFWPRDGYGCIHGAVATPRNSSATSSTLVLVDSSRWPVHEKPTIIWFNIAGLRPPRPGFAQGQGVINHFAPRGRQLRIEAPDPISGNWIRGGIFSGQATFRPDRDKF
jgi:hypothetical protein